MAKYNLPNYTDKDGLGFPLNFRRGNPNPLDNSSVWATLEAAQNYAATDATAYVGQILSVVDYEKGIVTVYSIQDEAGKLERVGTVTLGDDKTIIKNADNTLSIKGFAEAAVGAQLVKGSDGSLSWVVPSAETVEGLKTNVNALLKTVNGDEETTGLVDRMSTTESDIDNLETALEGKAASEHTHEIDDVTGLQTAINEAKQAGTDAKTYAEGVAGDLNTLAGRVTTAEGEIDSLQATITGLTGAMHYRGTVEADPTVTVPTLDPAAASGDVVIFGKQEFVYDGENWKLFGDEGSYLTKTEAEATYATKTELENSADSIEISIGRLTDSVNSSLSTINSELAGKADNGTVEALDGRVAANEQAIEVLQGESAKAEDLTALEGRVDTAEGKITTLEGASHSHDNKTVLDGITAEKVSAWDGAEAGAVATAKAYTEEYAAEKEHTHDEFTTLQNAINGKADASAVTGLAETVSTNTTSITGLQTALGNKADASAVTGLAETVGTNTSDIGTLKTTVAGKADSTTVADLTARVAANEGSITTLTGTGAGSVAKAEADAVATAKAYTEEYAAEKEHTHDVYADKEATEAHIDDSTIHVTSALKSKWDAAAAVVDELSGGAVGSIDAKIQAIQGETDSTIADVEDLVGKLPTEGTTATTVVGYVDESVSELETALDARLDTLEAIDHVDDVVYDSNTKKIYLVSGETQIGDGFDASAFIKDGMLESVTYSNEDNSITFTWNTDAGKTATTINLYDIIEAYTAGTGLTLTGTEFSLDAATQASLAKADTALQSADIATGASNGSISVKGTDVAVKGLGTAAYTSADAYDVKGAAATAEANAKKADERVVIKELTASAATAPFAVAIEPDANYALVKGLAKVIINSAVYVVEVDDTVIANKSINLDPDFDLEAEDNIYVEFREIYSPAN